MTAEMSHGSLEKAAMRRLSVLLDTERSHWAIEVLDENLVMLCHKRRGLTVAMAPALTGTCVATWRIRRHKWGWLPWGSDTRTYAFSDGGTIADSFRDAVGHLRGGSPSTRVKALIQFLGGVDDEP